MPRIRALSDREAELLRQRGLNPAQFAVSLPDLTGSGGGKLYDITKMEGPGIGEALGSGLRSVAQGFTSPVTMGLQAVGGGVEAATGWRGLSDAARATENFAQEKLGPDPRVSNWVNVPGQAVGQVGALMLPTGWVGNAARLSPWATRVLASVLGAGMTAGDTIGEELKRQEREGEERNINRAVTKGAGMGIAAAPLEMTGIGRIFGAADDAVLRSMSTARRLASIGGRSALNEAIEEGLQYATVEGPEGTLKPEMLAERTGLGALGGFTGGSVGSLGMNLNADVKPPGEEQVAPVVDQAEALANASSVGKVYVPSDTTLDAMEASVRNGTPWKPVGRSTPVDLLFEDLRKNKVPLLRDDIVQLFTVWGGNNANVGKLNDVARDMYERGVSGRTAKPIPTPDLVEAQREELGKFDTQIANTRTRYEALQKAMQDEAAAAEKAPAGTRWEMLNSRDRMLRQSEMEQLTDQLEALVQQKELLLNKQRDTSNDVRRPPEPGDSAKRYPVMSVEQSDAANLGRLRNIPAQPGESFVNVVPPPLEGQPVETGPVTPMTFPPIVSPTMAAEAAARQTQLTEVQLKAAQAVKAAEERMAALEARAAELEQDPRRSSPVQGIRQQVEDEASQIAKELEAEAAAVLDYRRQLPRDRSIIDAYMQGQPIPGMEGEQSLPFKPNASVDEQVREPIPVEIAQNLFDRLKSQQRGKPETLGTRFPKLFQGSIDYALEHVGDLVHRLAYTPRDGGGIQYGREAALEKIKRALRYAEDAARFGGIRGFVRAVAQKNFEYFKSPEGQEFADKLPDTFEEAWPILQQHLNDYALAHAELPAVSEFQQLAQEATVALGRLDHATYVDKLKELQAKLQDPSWESNWFKERDTSDVKISAESDLTNRARRRVDRALKALNPSEGVYSLQSRIDEKTDHLGWSRAKIVSNLKNPKNPIVEVEVKNLKGQVIGNMAYEYDYDKDSLDFLYYDFNEGTPETEITAAIDAFAFREPLGIGHRPRNTSNPNELNTLALEYEDAAGPDAGKVPNHRPLDWLRRAYKKAAESRQSYRKIIVEDAPRSNGVRVAGYYNQAQDKIVATRADVVTAFHESIHRTNRWMSRAINDHLMMKLARASTQGESHANLLRISQLAKALREISPIYDHLAVDYQKALDAPRFRGLPYAAYNIVDEALAQTIPEKLYGDGTIDNKQIAALEGPLEELGFNVRSFVHALATSAGEVSWNPSGSAFYSGLPVDLAWKGLKEGVKFIRAWAQDANFNPFNALYYRTRSVRSRLASLGPLGAYVAYNMEGMWRDVHALEARKMAELDTFKDFLAKPAVVRWVNDSINNQTEDFDALPENLRDEARRFMAFNRSFIEDMRARDQYVRTGNEKPRLPEVIPGFVPTSVDNKVWDELTDEKNPQHEKWMKIWIDNYRNQRPQDSEEQARAAFEEFAKPITAVHVLGGEPLFAAARKAHGINLPEQMRDQDLYAGYQRYISRVARDAVWTEKVQKNPLMRRALGVKLDHHFDDHTADDRLVQPDVQQWRQILREAKRVNAQWPASFRPGQELGMPLLVRNGAVGDVLIAGFNETPANRLSTEGRALNDFSQLAGSLLMETTTGLRDATFGHTELAAYVPNPTMVKRWGETVANYGRLRDQARKAGAVRMDVYRHQAANVVSTAAYKTAKTLRDITGRQRMDEFPRVFIYHMVREQVLEDFRIRGRSPLAEEFGEIGELSPEQQADATSAVVVNHIAPNYDPRSLPKEWVPQTRGLLGMMTQLSTFGIARYNTWYEDHYLRAVNSKNPDRLLRSLLFGVVGAGAAGALIDEIFKKKPAKMSWQEWMGLSTEEQQKEFAPLLFSMIQSQGLLGIMGDLALPLAQFGNKLMTDGGPPVSVPDLGEASIPGIIIFDQVLMTTLDFIQYAKSKGWKIDKYDLVDLSNEYMKTAQVWRDMQGWFTDSERDVARERRMYERLKGISALTEEPVEQPLFSQIVPRLGTRFSASREFNTRQGPALRSLMPGMIERAKQGVDVRIAGRDFTDEFWQDVARRRGLDVAKEMYEKVQKQRAYEPVRQELARRLNSVK